MSGGRIMLGRLALAAAVSFGVAAILALLGWVSLHSIHPTAFKRVNGRLRRPAASA